MKRSGHSIIGFGIIITILVISGLLGFPSHTDPILGSTCTYSLWGLLCIALLFLLTIFLSGQTSIMVTWMKGSSFGRIALIPLLTGILIGASLLAAFYIQGSSLLTFPSIDNIIYGLYMSVSHSLIFNFIPITIVMWLIVKAFKVKSRSDLFFWIFATVFSFIEPLFLTLQYIKYGITDNIAGSLVIIELMIIANLISFAFLKSRGLVPMLIMRMGIFLCWASIL